MKTSYTSIDLFCGPGGLATGFHWAGIKPLIAVEWSETTANTYALNHEADILPLARYLEDPASCASFFEPGDRTLLILGDINLVDDALIKKILESRFGCSSVDIVTGGAPCESFSMAGDRKEDDDRNELFMNILRIARAVDSKMFLFENVKGLFSKKHNGKAGAMYEYVCSYFESKIQGRPSYHLASKSKDVVLRKAVDYGVPQQRERLFLVGLNDRLQLDFTYPIPTHGPGKEFNFISVEDALMDLPQIDMGQESTIYEEPRCEVTKEACWYRDIMRARSLPSEHPITYLPNHKAPGHISKMHERIKAIRPGESMKSAYERLMAEGKEDLVARVFPKKIYAARNRRLLLDAPSFTVTSHCLDEMIHPVLDRGLSPREAARLQSFPDWYEFTGPYVEFHGSFIQDQYEQIGDAIPPLLAYALGLEIVNTLSKSGGD